MPTDFPNQKTKRRRYRTRMFDKRLSFPTTSEQVRQLQAESEAEGRSGASLIREAIDALLPRLRKRRKRQRTPIEPLADAPKAVPRLQAIVQQLYGDPQKKEVGKNNVQWFYGSMAINLSSGRWYDPEKKTHGSVLDLVMRELQLDQGQAIDWILDKGPGTSPGPATIDG